MTHRIGSKIERLEATLFLCFVLLGCVSFSQESIPVGTVLPVQLNSSLNSDRMHVGQVIGGRIMQDVPISGKARIRAGSKVLGRIAALEASNAGTAELAIRFDTVVAGKRRFAVETNLRALATMMDVEAAQLPPGGPDRGTSDFAWTTQQIGGETVYHGGGPVTRGSSVVGQSIVGGVLVPVSATPRCRGEIGESEEPQALWVFSSDACGLYDLPNLTLLHAGRSEPRGEIRIRAGTGPVKIPGGSGMLLRVQRQK